MNEVAHRPDQVQLIPLTGGRGTLVGPPQRVRLALEHLRSTGRLLNAADPVADGFGGLVVNVRMRVEQPPVVDVPPPRPSWWTRRRIAVAVVVVLVVLAVIAAAGWLLLSWVAAHAVLVGLVLLGVVALTGGGSCVTVVRVFHRH